MALAGSEDILCGEHQLLTANQLYRLTTLQQASADLRPLQIGDDGDMHMALGSNRAHRADVGVVIAVAAVREVQAHSIGALFKDAAQRRFAARGWAHWCHNCGTILFPERNHVSAPGVYTALLFGYNPVNKQR